MAGPVGVVGAGTMGLGIAEVFLGVGDVLLTDARAAAREGARGQVAEALGRRVAAGRLSEAERDARLGRLRVVEGPEGMGGAEIVVEAVVEDLAVKRGLLRALERTGAVLATNTSSLSVAELAEGLARPSRLLGLHFFNPAPAMRLVELVRHGGTDPGALALARGLAEAAGKVVVECPDSPGFVVNRVARPFYGEALALLEEGRGAAEVDGAMLARGYRMGPFALIDLVGADVHLLATRGVWERMGRHPRYRVFPALERQVAAGDLGRKAGRGFLWPEAPVAAPDDAVAGRIEALVVNEAGWLLAEGGVGEADVDRAMVLGMGWPRGPFAILAERGAPAIRAALAAAGAGGRYEPAPALR